MKHVLLLSSLLILASCTQSSAPPQTNGGGNSVAWTTPAVGTSYIFETPSIFGKPVFDSITILQNGQHLGGKTNAIGVADHAGTLGAFFYAIEQNGDISYGDSSFTTPSVYSWKTFPTANDRVISDPSVDTIQQGLHIVKSDVRTFVGAENTTTAAGTFATLHVRETSINIVHGPDSLGCNASDTSITDIWFAPSIGWQVKITNNGTSNGQLAPQTETDLIKYLPM